MAREATWLVAADRRHPARLPPGTPDNRRTSIRHARLRTGHTVGMSIWYGPHVADDGELRLCGDVAGKRVIELGIAQEPNSIAMAIAGAKAIAVDADQRAIATLRAAAERAEVRVECHQGDLADLGFATSASVDLVVAAHSLTAVDDLPRVLRQVHRVLKPGAPFVVATTHPVAAMFTNDATATYAYGAGASTFAELYMAFERSNFHLDMVHELPDRRVRDPLCPSVLVLRARKQGV
ncbi:MAG: class I SAM-dependent methyltransferase [Actinomycetota bacterium]|nr:class I SAM-dependent methyltransferase [Actinomycetota bacterium]